MPSSGVNTVLEEAQRSNPELLLVARQRSATEQTGEHWKPEEQTLLPQGLSVGGGRRLALWEDSRLVRRQRASLTVSQGPVFSCPVASTMTTGT